MDGRTKRRMLEDITNLKAENYVGTQEAWNYLQALKRKEERLDFLVNALNYHRDEEITIERRHILGAYWGINLLLGKFHREYCNLFPEEKELSKSIAREDRLNSLDKYNSEGGGAFLKKESKDFMDVGRDIDLGVDVYLEAKNERFLFLDVPIEEGLGKCVLAATIANSSLNESERNLINSLADKIDIGRIMTTEDMLKIDELLERHARHEYISLPGKIDRIKKDKIDHRLWIRREIAIDYIAHFGDYQAAETEMKCHLNESKRRIVGFESIDGSSNEGTMVFNALNKERKMLSERKYILACLTSNKPFLERYLKN